MTFQFVRRHTAAMSASFVILLALLICGWGAWYEPLHRWDESIYAGVTLEMEQHGSWLTPIYHDQLFAEKPPLLFWLTRPLFFLFGPVEWAVRFWSVLAGVATALLIWVWGRQASQRDWIGLLAALIFLSSRFIYHHSFRAGETDGLLVAVWTGVMYAYWRSWKDDRWWHWVGIGLGLLFLIKPIVGLIPLAVILIDVYFRHRGGSNIRGRSVLIAFGLMLLITLPWHIYMFVQHGSVFFDQYFGFHVLDRAAVNLASNPVSSMSYWSILEMRFFPWIAFVPITFLFAILRAHWRGPSLERLLILWAAAVLIAFTFIQTRFEWYILPIYPSLVLLLALFFWAAVEKTNRWFGLAWLISAGYGLFILLRHVQPGSMITTILVSASLVIIGWVVVILRIRWWHKMQQLILVGLVVAMMIYATWPLWQLPKVGPYDSLVAAYERLGRPELDVVDIDMRQVPDLYFYVRRASGRQYHEGIQNPDSSRAILTRDSVSTILLQKHPVVEQSGSFVLLGPGILD